MPAFASSTTYRKILGRADKPKRRRQNVILSIEDIDGESDHDLQPAKKRRRTARIRRPDAILDRRPQIGLVGGTIQNSENILICILLKDSLKRGKSIF